MTAEASAHPALKAAIGHAKAQYFGGFRSLADKMKAASADGATYPITAADWVNTTTPQLGALLEVIVRRLAGQRGSCRQPDGDRAPPVGRNAVLLVVGLLLAGTCAWIVLQRVTGPIERMRGEVARWPMAISSMRAASMRRGATEIGAMARGLEVLRRGLAAAAGARAEQEADSPRRVRAP